MAKNNKIEKDLLDKESPEISSGANLESPENGKEIKEYKELLTEDEVRELREKIDATNLDDDVKLQASTQASTIQSLDEKAKLEKLLQAAKKRGVAYAIEVAKNMNDPFILDKFHDVLVQEGYYKKFLK